MKLKVGDKVVMDMKIYNERYNCGCCFCQDIGRLLNGSVCTITKIENLDYRIDFEKNGKKEYLWARPEELTLVSNITKVRKVQSQKC